MHGRHPSPEALDHISILSFLPRHKVRPAPLLTLAIPSSCPTTVTTLARPTDKCLLVKMPHLTLAPHQPSRSVYDAYSPDHSEYSYSSDKYARSRSPSPPRRASPPPARRMPRSNTVSHPRPVSVHHTLPRCQTHPSDLSSVAGAGVFRRPSRSGNEEVLRSRLEGVLSTASTSRDFSCPPSPQRKRAATAGESSYGLHTPPFGTLPAMTRSRTSPAASRSSPITPPSSPPFDATRVALQLRDREGYVSFADVEGLGAPSDDQDISDTERGRARWWSLWKG